MSEDSITLDVKVGGDTKVLDETIAKVKILNAEVNNLSKNLKSADANFAFKVSKASLGKDRPINAERAKTPIQLRREELATSRINLGFARVRAGEEALALGAVKRERSEQERIERIKLREAKQEEKRRKQSEKDAKKFFGVIHNGFEKALKIGLGVLTGGAGIIGAGLLAGRQATNVANLGAQQGLDVQEAQKWANVLIRANPSLNKEQALGIIGGLQSTLATIPLGNAKATGAVLGLGLSTGERSAINVLEAIRNKDFQSADIFTQLLGDLGIDPAAANALNRNKFSAEEFRYAQGMGILTEEEIQANKEFAAAVAEFKNAVDILSGKILAKLAPAAKEVVGTLTGPDTPEKADRISRAKRSAIGATIFGAGLGLLTGHPLLGAGLGFAGGAGLAFRDLAGVKPDYGLPVNALSSFVNPLGLGKNRKSGRVATALPEDVSNYTTEDFDRIARENPEQFRDLISEYTKATMLPKSTGGSSGQPINATIKTDIHIGQMDQAMLPNLQQRMENTGYKMGSSIQDYVNPIR